MKYFNNLKFAAPFVFITSISMAMETVVQPVIEFTNNVAQGQIHFEYRIQRNYPNGAVSPTMMTHTDTYAPWQKYIFMTTDFGNPNYPLCLGDCIHLDKLIFEYEKNNMLVKDGVKYTNCKFVLGEGTTIWHDLAGKMSNDVLKWQNDTSPWNYTPPTFPNWPPIKR